MSRSTELWPLLLLPVVVVVVAVARWRVLLFLFSVVTGAAGVVRHLDAAPPKRLEFSLNSAFKRSRTQISNHQNIHLLTRPAPSESLKLLREYIILIEIIINKSKRTKEKNKTL